MLHLTARVDKGSKRLRRLLMAAVAIPCDEPLVNRYFEPARNVDNARQLRRRQMEMIKGRTASLSS
jgi:hypothetical protein